MQGVSPHRQPPAAPPPVVARAGAGSPGSAPAPVAGADSATGTTVAVPASVAGRPALPMPPRRSGWGRVQLNTRVRVEVEQLLQRFVDDNHTTVQSSVDLALVEFLAARGYVLPRAEDR